MATTRQEAPAQSRAVAFRSLVRVPSLYDVGFLTIMGALLVLALAPRIEGDFWWHLEAGRTMAATHAVPRYDFLSFTATGHPWTDQEWLTELIMYGLYQGFGLWAPLLFFAAVICAAFGLVYATMVMRGVNHMLALFVVSAAFIASFASWGPRAQMLTLLFLALYGLLLLWFERERDRRLLVALPVLMLLWTNLHGGWILGLVVLVLTLIGETLNRLTKRDGAFSAADMKALALATLACLLVTVVNPYGLQQALYPLVWVFPSAYSNHIAEWASPDFHVSVMMVFEAMLLLLVLAWSRARAGVSWTWVLLAIVFTYLALSELRNVPTWSIVVSPILGVALQTQLPALKYRRRAVAGRTAAVLNITLLLGCAVFYVAIASHYVTPQAVNADVKQNFPQGAITYLRTHSEPSRVFATYVWGGYLTWNLYPRYRDFIDGRANTVFSSAVLLDYLAAYQGAPSWSTILRRYGVNAVLVEPGAALAQILAHIPTWKLVYHDPGSVLYVRR